MLPIITSAVVAAQLAAAPPAAELRGAPLMQELRAGGYTIVLRHARTDRSIPTKETPGYTPALRSDQRNLTAAGEEDVRLMREVVNRYQLPIGEVLSSPIYRCRETADAFGPAVIDPSLRAFPSPDEARALIAAAPKPGTNRVIVTHHFVIETHVPGIKPGDIGESEAAVVKPDGRGSVVLVGKIALSDWRELAGGTAVAPAAPPVHAPSAHGPPVSIPATRAGGLASKYIAAFNSGDTEQMRAFIQSFLVANPERPTEARLQNYRSLYETYGRLLVTDVRSSVPDTIALNVRARSGDIVLTVIAAPDGGRAQSVSFGIPGGHR